MSHKPRKKKKLSVAEKHRRMMQGTRAQFKRMRRDKMTAHDVELEGELHRAHQESLKVVLPRSN